MHNLKKNPNFDINSMKITKPFRVNCLRRSYLAVIKSTYLKDALI